MTDIVILTDRDHLYPDTTASQEQLGFLEDDLLLKALQNQGLSIKRIAWDDLNFDWTTTRSAIFRSTWDYFHRFPEFSQWLKKVATQTSLLNSKHLIHWNIDKHYLLDLKNKGVHIATSHFIEKGTILTLKELHANLGWEETVLKPCISGTARHTYRLNRTNLAEHEAIFKELIRIESMILQPFQFDFIHRGEISLMFFGNQFSHAVLKTPKKDDFRVQRDFGGSVQMYQPSSAEISFALNSLQCCPETPSYARVDIFNDNEGRIALSELELIEPELFYRLHPEAAIQHAKHLAALIKKL